LESDETEVPILPCEAVLNQTDAMPRIEPVVERARADMAFDEIVAR
jgi:hypothetical protein